MIPLGALALDALFSETRASKVMVNRLSVLGGGVSP